MITLTAAFQTAKENMHFDETLLQHCQADGQPRLRIYTWNTSSLTYPKRSASLFDAYQTLDHSDRLTGGGIVCHAKNDLVWTFAQPIPNIKTPLKTCLCALSDWIKTSLARHNLQVEKTIPTPIEKNILYCLTYESPYELYHNGQKIAGIAIRKFQNTHLVQGIIHREISPSFPELTALSLPKTQGLQAPHLTPEKLSQTLFENFTLR